MRAGSAVIRAAASAALLCGLAAPGWGSTVWNESVNGDLSNDGLAPTPLVMAGGDNGVLGVTGNPGTGIDRDYFRLVVPAGHTLAAIMLLPNTSVSGAVSFVAIQPGPQVTVSPGGAGAEQLVALGHYGSDQIGTDILPGIVLGNAVLSAGVYSVWVQDTSGTATYGLNFVMTPIPPPPWAVGGLGTALLWLAHRRKRLA